MPQFITADGTPASRALARKTTRGPRSLLGQPHTLSHDPALSLGRATKPYHLASGFPCFHGVNKKPKTDGKVVGKHHPGGRLSPKPPQESQGYRSIDETLTLRLPATLAVRNAQVVEKKQPCMVGKSCCISTVLQTQPGRLVGSAHRAHVLLQPCK